MTKITKEDVDKLAELARVEMSDKEKDGIREDLESILGYVSEIQEVATTESPAQERVGMLRNVMREDENPTEEKTYTKKIVESAPKSEGDYVKVKKILS